jgi:hypothetical protein
MNESTKEQQSGVRSQESELRIKKAEERAARVSTMVGGQ